MPDTLEAVIDRGIAEGLDDAELRLLAQEFAQSSQSDESPTGFLGRMVSNIPRSAGQAVEGTLQGVADLGRGLVTDPLGTLGGIVPGIVDHYSRRYGSPEARRETVGEDPVGMVFDMLPARALTKAPAAARAVGRGARNAAAGTAQFVADHPRAVSTAAGVATGAPAGPAGAVLGGLAGYSSAGTAGSVAESLAKALRPGKAAQTASTAAPTLPPALAALMGGAKFDELAAIVRQTRPDLMRSSAPAARAAVPSTLSSEVMARQALASPIDWERMDVTPLKRPGTNILFGEESTPGLNRMLKEALLENDRTLVSKLEKALRQRAHITGKSGN